MQRVLCVLLLQCLLTSAQNLYYLDPTKLQTKTSPAIQSNAAATIINNNQVTVEVDPNLFTDKKDTFVLRTTQASRVLLIRASSGVAAVWGYNYYLKKYCKSQIAWQVSNVRIPSPLPEVDEVVTANDRFRYYQNVCTASYSFLWWDVDAWQKHVAWMALNGINLALAPVAQEAAWLRVYRRLGMTQDEIDEHFTGPAFLAWLRMGNVHCWGGPLPPSWHDRQKQIQDMIIKNMLDLGMVPVLPAFNGHVPRAFKRIFPNSTFHSVGNWNKFSNDYCCGLFLDPLDPVFKQMGREFLNAIAVGSGSHIYTADPFNEVEIESWSTDLVVNTAKSIYSFLTDKDEQAVWLIQNWMFVHDPLYWPKSRVKSFLTSVPNGRLVVLDLQSEQWPQYNLYEMYFGQPFIWCMLHNFGGTLGLFGNMRVINSEVYLARARADSTMLGVGITPEGINQNYVMYELMLESAWRKSPVQLEAWLEEYAERRYGCNTTGRAWRYLLRSVYSFDGLNKMRGKYVITRRPSMRLAPWAWYRSHDLMEAWRSLALSADTQCTTEGFYYDLVDVTRQALQYRAEQLYVKMQNDKLSNTWAFNRTIGDFLDVMYDLEQILASNVNFVSTNWLTNARNLATSTEETYLYDLNARNQITQWGPNGEISDYACKQWAEMFHYYYTPRWRMFLSAALDARSRNEFFDEKAVQAIVSATVERQFLTNSIENLPQSDTKSLAVSLFEKWAIMPGFEDLPNHIIYRNENVNKVTDMNDDDYENVNEPTVIMLGSTTPG